MSVPTITAVRLTGAANRAELPLLVLGPSLGTSATTLWSRLRGRAHRRLRRRRLGPPGPRAQPRRARGVVHDGRARAGRAPRGRGDPRAARPVPRPLRLRRRLGRRLRRAAAPARPPGPGRLGGAALHRGQDRRARHVGRPGRPGQRVRHLGDGLRVGRALVRPGLPRPRAGHGLRAAARAPGRRRPGLHRRCARRWRTSTCAIGSARSPRPCWPSPGQPTWPRRPRTCDEIAEQREGRPLRRARRRRPPGPRRGARRGGPADPPARAGRGPEAPSHGSQYDAGMAVRREVLGDAHVDRATAGATDFTREFQEFITEYAWGGIWTRPGLDRRSRSMITLTALIARGHHEELAMHVRAARTNGLTADEIKELILQSAIYCGVPDANTAFRIAQGVLDETRSRPQKETHERRVRLRRRPHPVRQVQRRPGRRTPRRPGRRRARARSATAPPTWTRAESTR